MIEKGTTCVVATARRFVGAFEYVIVEKLASQGLWLGELILWNHKQHSSLVFSKSWPDGCWLLTMDFLLLDANPRYIYIIYMSMFISNKTWTWNASRGIKIAQSKQDKQQKGNNMPNTTRGLLPTIVCFPLRVGKDLPFSWVETSDSNLYQPSL